MAYRPLLNLCAIAFLASSASSQLAAQSDNFDDRNDVGWSRYNPLSPFAAGAAYSYPDGGYAIIAPASPAPDALGPQRAGSLLSGKTLPRVRVQVDIGRWNDQINQAFGLLTRVQNVGLGTTEGYSFNYNTRSGFHQLTVIQNEAPLRQVNESPFRLSPAARYTMVFTAAEGILLGQVFSSTNAATPIHSVVGRDETHQTGLAGVFAFSLDPLTGVNAWFDNYSYSVPEKLRATFLDASPAAGESPTNSIPSVQVRLAHLETKVLLPSIRLEIDGAQVPFTTDDTQTVLFLEHTPSAPLSASSPHKAKVSFDDADGTQTFEWSFGSPQPTQSTPPSLQTASTVNGPFSVEPAAQVDTSTGSITLPRVGPQRFFRIVDTSPRTILGAAVSDTTVTIRYR